ncbi:hypothetical protein RER_18940 [Rhodococcus erythropolis PR4]|uniref:Helix-turn-helix domain-containing protein n=1 Tax=Rhodococcus erythropolis (strain PR4 / NBRC 100887) TaxID=234621 RepID=C0ZW67_RHOE4|nr:hypothetical protein RER_18940 [Rhodococcus erythropolis PR4]
MYVRSLNCIDDNSWKPRQPTWLTHEEALKHVGKGASTLRRWRYRGEVTALKSVMRGGWIYERTSLEACKAEQARRYDERPCPGPWVKTRRKSREHSDN